MSAKIREAIAAMKSCIMSGEPWTLEMEKALQLARGELDTIDAAPHDRAQMVERFSAREAEVLEAVHRIMLQRQDATGAHVVTRLVVQALLYGPDAALKG